MALVRKKTPKSSSEDLKVALGKLIYLLEGQKEDDAVADLRIALRDLEQYLPASAEHQGALQLIIEAFEGEHELQAYTFRREGEQKWSAAEELYLASIEVINLTRRLMAN